MYDVRFRTPFTCIMAGATSSGKTYLLSQILKIKKEMFTKPPDRTILFYAVHQSIYDGLLSSGAIDEMHEGTMSKEEIGILVSKYKKGNGSCIIFDDAIHNISDEIAQLFTTYSHHWKMSVFFLTQNIFVQNKSYRNMALNAHYYIIMANARGRGQLATLGRELFPYRSGYIMDAFNKAIENSEYGYILIDMAQRVPDIIRVRNNLLQEEPGPITVYIEKQSNTI